MKKEEGWNGMIKQKMEQQIGVNEEHCSRNQRHCHINRNSGGLHC